MNTALARPTNLKGISSTLASLWAWVDAHARALLIGMLVLYFAVFSAASIFKLETLQQGFDMAGNEQTIWNTLHGRFFETSVFAKMQYDFDDGPVLLEVPLAGLYALYPSPHILLVLQTLAITLGALPLYLLARDLWKRASAGLVAAAVYLLHPTVQHMNLYEFQYRSFSLAFALAAFYFFEKKKWGWWALFLVLAMATKTESALLVIFFGLYALLRRRPWTYVVPPIVAGAAWFYVALFVIVPHYTQGGSFAASIYSYGWLGNSFGEILRTLVTRPGYVLAHVFQADKLRFLFSLFFTLVFLPLLSPLELLLALPILGLNLLSPNLVQYSLYYQYQALTLPFLLVAALYGLHRLQLFLEKRRSWPGEQILNVALVILLLFAGANSLFWKNALWNTWRHRDTPQRIADARAVLARVPDGSPVAASTFLAPFLAQREGIYFFPGNKSYPQEYIARADYLVTDTGPSLPIKGQELLQQYLADGSWQVELQQGDFLLLRRTK